MNVDHLEKEYAKISRSLAGIGYICPGSVVKRYMPCGKPSCRCADPRLRHGPYYEWSRKIGGKTMTVRLTAHQARLYQGWIKNDRLAKKRLDQMRSIAMRVAQSRLSALALIALLPLFFGCAAAAKNRLADSDPFFDERIAAIKNFLPSFTSFGEKGAGESSGANPKQFLKDLWAKMMTAAEPLSR